MTKAVRIENADTGTHYKVRVRTFAKGHAGHPDQLVAEQILSYPTALTNNNTYISADRYLVVDEIHG
jgi:hypothetical protein